MTCAITTGYGLIDAAGYGNEREGGDAIARGGFPCSDLFVTAKLWISDYGYEQALHGFDASLRGSAWSTSTSISCTGRCPRTLRPLSALYRAAERLLAEGRVRAIGVCKFKPNHLQDLVAQTEVTPAENQHVELHPFFSQREVRDWDARHGVIPQPGSPIGGIYLNHPQRPERSHETPRPSASRRAGLVLPRQRLRAWTSSPPRSGCWTRPTLHDLADDLGAGTVPDGALDRVLGAKMALDMTS